MSFSMIGHVKEMTIFNIFAIKILHFCESPLNFDFFFLTSIVKGKVPQIAHRRANAVVSQ